MFLARWNWLDNVRRRMTAKFSESPAPSKFTRRGRWSQRAEVVEALEARLQLSSANFVDGRLSIEVTGDDDVQISAASGEAIVKVNGRAIDVGSVASNEVTEIVVAADAQSFGHNRIDLSRVHRSQRSRVGSRRPIRFAKTMAGRSLPGTAGRRSRVAGSRLP